MSDAAAYTGRAPSPGVLGLLSDSRLARRAAEGDQRAFAAIYGRYHQDLYRYCRTILRDPQEAQDALQNTMVKVLSSLPGEEREIRLKPWLYRIAHNESVELLRRRRPTAELDPDAADPEGRPEDSVELRGRLAELLGDLRELPDRQRGALAMRELSGLSFEQIAEALETSPAAARQTVYEARTALQTMSEGREMSCDTVRRALSDGDGRVLRKREIRAHLRACEGCSDFKAAITARRREFAAIGPLPAVAAAGLLNSLFGGGGGTGGGLAALLGGGAGGAGAASAGLKSAAAVVAVSAVGVGAAAGGGLIDAGSLLGSGGNDTASEQKDANRTDDASTAAGGAATSAGRAVAQGARRRGASGRKQGSASSKRRKKRRAANRGAHGQRTAATARARRGRPTGLPAAAEHGQQTAASHGGGQATAKPAAPPPPPPEPASSKPKPAPAPSPSSPNAAESGLPSAPASPGGGGQGKGKP